MAGASQACVVSEVDPAAVQKAIAGQILPRISIEVRQAGPGRSPVTEALALGALQKGDVTILPADRLYSRSLVRRVLDEKTNPSEALLLKAASGVPDSSGGILKLANSAAQVLAATSPASTHSIRARTVALEGSSRVLKNQPSS